MEHAARSTQCHAPPLIQLPTQYEPVRRSYHEEMLGGRLSRPWQATRIRDLSLSCCSIIVETTFQFRCGIVDVIQDSLLHPSPTLLNICDRASMH
eukprot:1756975-Amphidinium_carterae.1